MGYIVPPANAQPRECGGSVAAGLRELESLAEAGSWEEYHRRRPHGLTREGAAMWTQRLDGEQVAGAPPLRSVSLDGDDIIDPAVTEGMDALDLMLPAARQSFGRTLEKLTATMPQPGSPEQGEAS